MSSVYEVWAKNKEECRILLYMATKKRREKVDLIKQEIERKAGIRKCEFKVGCFVLCKTGSV